MIIVNYRAGLEMKLNENHRRTTHRMVTSYQRCGGCGDVGGDVQVTGVIEHVQRILGPFKLVVVLQAYVTQAQIRSV